MRWFMAVGFMSVALLAALMGCGSEDARTDGVVPPAPTATAAETSAPDVLGEDVAEARKRVEAIGLRLRIRNEGEGDVILNQTPPGGVKVAPGTFVTVRVGSR